MILELLTLGDELLDGRRVDTNTAWLGRKFTALGIPPRFRQTTTDRMEDIVAAFQLALSRADLVISTGGLGPTADDITFEALAKALGRPLEFYPDVFRRIEKRFEEKGIRCPSSNRRQAMLPRGTVELVNEWGTAPGGKIEEEGKTVFVLPGVPLEMENLFERHVQPKLEEALEIKERRFERIYKIVGLPESHVEERVDACKLSEIKDADIRIAYTASFPQIDVTLSAASKSLSADKIFKETDKRISESFGDHWVALNQETLEERVIRELQNRKWTLSVAESLTGGLVLSQLINVPGSSEVIESGVVAYSNKSKVELLGVAEQNLQNNGAVSESCALEMAKGIQKRAETTLAVATTGIAGPGGGATPEKPVGLLYIAWVGPQVEEVRRYQFSWERNRNRMLAATEALRGLLRIVAGPHLHS